MLRGGSWNNNDNRLRAANRNRNTADNRNNNNGFRLLLQSARRVNSLRPDCVGQGWRKRGRRVSMNQSPAAGREGGSNSRVRTMDGGVGSYGEDPAVVLALFYCRGNKTVMVGWKERNVSFEEVIFHIEHGGLLDDIVHPNASAYPNQRIFIVGIRDYVYLVPYVESEDEVFLKTIIPSRKFTRLYPGGGS